MRHRPIGLGVQGLADTFVMMRLPFESEQAKRINREIFETSILPPWRLHGACANRGPYQTYGSPVSKGIFQFDMWGVTPNSGRWGWYDQAKSKNMELEIPC